MDHWLNLKCKRSDGDDGNASYSKQNEVSSSDLKKCRRYSNEYLLIGFPCTGLEDNQLPQLCYNILSNKTMKPSKLRRRLDTKQRKKWYKEHTLFKR